MGANEQSVNRFVKSSIPRPPTSHGPRRNDLAFNRIDDLHRTGTRNKNKQSVAGRIYQHFSGMRSNLDTPDVFIRCCVKNADFTIGFACVLAAVTYVKKISVRSRDALAKLPATKIETPLRMLDSVETVMGGHIAAITCRCTDTHNGETLE